jgi:hypothetical protein
MPDLHHQNDASVVVDAVDDSVVALPDTIVLEARELLAPMWSRLSGELLDSSDDSSAVFDRESLQLFDGRRLDKQAIACHAASGL